MPKALRSVCAERKGTPGPFCCVLPMASPFILLTGSPGVLPVPLQGRVRKNEAKEMEGDGLHPVERVQGTVLGF